MSQTEIFERLGVSLLLGLLVGLQREHVATKLAGMRTFPMITVLGTLLAIVDRAVDFHGILISAGVVALAALVVVGKIEELRQEKAGLGLTTEVAILVMYAVGAFVATGDRTIAVAVGVGVAALLQFKPELHGLAARLGDEDLRAVMQFALITCVVLPILPNKYYGPYGALNPFEIWLMVVLIVGIELSGYIIYKFFGERAGLLLGGLLGGAISSTATTAGYARRTVQAPEQSRTNALIVAIASCVLFPRVLIVIAVVAPLFVVDALLPMGVMFVASVLATIPIALDVRKHNEPMPVHQNPTELRSAIVFAGFFALVTFCLAAAKAHLGERGLFLVAVLSGLPDVNPVTLSVSQMVQQSVDGARAAIDVRTAWKLIVAASLSNLLFRVAIAGFLGHPRFFRWLVLSAVLPTLAAVGLLVAGSTPW